MSKHTPLRNQKVDTRMTEEEKAHITTLAKRSRLSVGETIRRLIAGKEPPPYDKHDAVIKLCEVNGNLARLGNLYKLSINRLDKVIKAVPGEAANLEDMKNDISAGHKSIKATQKLLYDKIKQL